MSNSACLNGARDLVLHHLHADVRADDVLLVLHRADAADVEPHRRVELERLAAGRRLGVAEHDADLFTQLIDEHHRRLRPRDRARQLAQRLAHEPRLQTHVRVAHVAFDFGLRHERRDRVDHDDVHRAGAHEDLADLERLLTRVGLRDQQRLDVHAQLSARNRYRARARRRCTPRRRRPAARSRRRANTASSCRSTPGRRSR